MFFKTNAPEAVQAITDFFAKKSALHARNEFIYKKMIEAQE